MYPQFHSFSPYPLLPKLSQATLVEPTLIKPSPSFSNNGQTQFLYWRNYDIIGLDRNTAPSFFMEMDKRIHIALTEKRTIFASKRLYQNIELRMDIVPYNQSERDLYDHETAFFLRCGKAIEWDKWEAKTLHEVVKGTLFRGCTFSFSQIEIARA